MGEKVTLLNPRRDLSVLPGKGLWWRAREVRFVVHAVLHLPHCPGQSIDSSYLPTGMALPGFLLSPAGLP